MEADTQGGRIAVYRRRRGLSQAALAGLVGRSESWLSQVERGVRGVDRMSVLFGLARVLDVDLSRLTGTSSPLSRGHDRHADGVDAVRDALMQYAHLSAGGMAVPTASEVARTADALHRRYQAAEYGEVTVALPGLIRRADALSSTADAGAVGAYVGTYVLASKHMAKLGIGDLAALTADRAATTAARTGSSAMQGAALYQVIVAQLRDDETERADRLAVETAEHLSTRADAETPAVVSVVGSLWLISAVIAARRANGSEALRRLGKAERLADALGSDANYAWTAFGPTNVAIHRVSVAAELGDPAAALAASAAVDLDRLPVGLTSRRAQVGLDLAWAHAQRRRDADATLHLLDAEAAAPEAIARNPLAREVVRTMLSRARPGSSGALAALATRAGVVA